MTTVLPVLDDRRTAGKLFWVSHAAAVTRRLEALAPGGDIILVGHSGAGPLLPTIGAFSPHPITGYMFVDAGLPHPGHSPLEEIEAALPEFGSGLRRDLEAGGSFPTWTDEDLREIVPDPGLRQGLLAELQPRDLTYFAEPMPHITGWPDAPCAYIRLSDAYDAAAQEARRMGWPYRELDAGHFHMLVDPRSMATAILELANALR
jgi:hypothetical protein